jgi:predicted DNA-binding protein YlxM (UPF0122 family)
MRKDFDEIKRMYDSGMSLEEIAKVKEVTRQSIHSLFKTRKIPLRPQLKYGKDNNFYRGGSIADDQAQNKAEKSNLEKKPCEVCGANGTFKDGRSEVQAHHCDYNKPLEVMWLCQKHHHEWHKNNKAKAKI